jgi:hypothetical protein
MVNLGLGFTSAGQSLLPGEIVKNSGKFAKPTKIPGKNYSKDEIIIRNADSGKGKISCRKTTKNFFKKIRILLKFSPC